jgi:4-hydroxy-tetrahydrodipicolinate synthase
MGAAATSSPGSAPGGAPRLAGVLAPVLTPFRADRSPDPGRLATLCRWLLGQGCAGLAVFGTTSEANSLTVEERERLLEAILAAGVPPAALMPGTGSCALGDAVRLTGLAVRSGCAGVLVLPPFYYKGVPEEGLFRFFSELVERVGDRRLRLYLYHIPPVAQVGIPDAVVERLLARYPGAVAGMKDSSGDWAHAQATLSAFAGSGFDVFVGSERFLLANLKAGGAGCITATGNVNAAGISRLWREWRTPGAGALQAGLDAVRGAFEGHPVVAALKAVVARSTGDPAWRTVRPPLVELAPEREARLLADLETLGFRMAAMEGGPVRAGDPVEVRSGGERR